MCRLDKALYGHPEAGAHWEHHLASVIKSMGGISIYGHPSCFWLPTEKLRLTVYVDDLLLSGPSGEHSNFWKVFATRIKIEEPTDLALYLGRNHEFTDIVNRTSVAERFKTSIVVDVESDEIVTD